MKVARINQSHLATQELSDALSELQHQQVRLVYWSSDRECEIAVIKKFCGNLADRKTTFAIDFCSLDFNKIISTDIVEPFADSMSVADLESLAIQSGEYSRFAVDPNWAAPL